MNFAITGVTGLLGRNLLFEIIKSNLESLDSIKIFVFGRSNEDSLLEQRVFQILDNDGIDYIGRDIYLRKKERIRKVIHCITIDLDDEKLSLCDDDFKLLKNQNIACFYHIASLTDFRSTEGVRQSLYKTIFEGTNRLLELIATLDVKELCYVSTAYACGSLFGVLEPNCYDKNEKYRNPYEKIKYQAECSVRRFCIENSLKYRIFRPSTICGRLIEQPIGSISKFDVFYSWLAWFYRLKLKANSKDLINDPINFDLRVFCNFSSGLNIVPADYMAKIMYNITILDYPGVDFHLVNENETKHNFYIPLMLNSLNIKGVKLVEEMPTNLNKFEAFYYKTVGGVFTPYITSSPMLFDFSNIKGLLKKINLKGPDINKNNFTALIDYALNSKFGLSKE